MGKKIDSTVAIEIMEKAGFTPLGDYPGSSVKWMCKCRNCKREIFKTLSEVKSGSGCKFCSAKRAAATKRIPESDAVTLMRINGLEPLEPYVNSQTKWKCRCLVCGRVVFPRYTSTKSLRSGCRYCAGNKVDVIEALTLMRAKGLEPLVKFPGSRKPWKSKCLKCEKITSPQYSALKRGQGGCKFCGGSYPIEQELAILRMVNRRLLPLEPYKNANSRWECECLICGSVVYPAYATIQQGGGGCPSCAKYGFKPESESYLYFLKNRRLASFKIGIANVTKKKTADRLHRLKLRGWEVISIWNFDTGKLAQEVEKSCLEHIRKILKVPVHLSSKEMPLTGGHTETFGIEEISESEVIEIIRKAKTKLSKELNF